MDLLIGHVNTGDRGKSGAKVGWMEKGRAHEIASFLLPFQN